MKPQFQKLYYAIQLDDLTHHSSKITSNMPFQAIDRESDELRNIKRNYYIDISALKKIYCSLKSSIKSFDFT